MKSVLLLQSEKDHNTLVSRDLQSENKIRQYCTQSLNYFYRFLTFC